MSRRRIQTKGILGYDPNGVWYDRLEAVQDIKRFVQVDEEVLSDLQQIVEQEDDPRVKETARKFIDQFENLGLLSPNNTYTKEQEQTTRKGARIELNPSRIPQYDSGNIWYQRKQALENQVILNTPDSGIIKDLGLIAVNEDNWMVAEAAKEMIHSYQENGDFSQTTTYKRTIGERDIIERTIDKIVDFIGGDSRLRYITRINPH